MQLKVVSIEEGRERPIKLNAAQKKVIEQVCKMNVHQRIEYELPDRNHIEAMDRFSKPDHLPGARNEEGYKAFITRENSSGL